MCQSLKIERSYPIEDLTVDPVNGLMFWRETSRGRKRNRNRTESTLYSWDWKCSSDIRPMITRKNLGPFTVLHEKAQILITDLNQNELLLVDMRDDNLIRYYLYIDSPGPTVIGG